MDPPPAEGNFCDDSNRPVKPHIVERYNRHMGFVNISDCMANSYLMSRRNFKWTVFPPSRSNSTQQLDSVIFKWGSIYHPRFQTSSGEEFDWRSWKKAKIAPSLVRLEDHMQQQQILCGSTTVITDTGQQNPRNSAAVFVHLAARERPRYNATNLAQIWCDFDRASSLICGNKMPTRCNRGFYCRSYRLLYMFRAPLCPSSGAPEYYTVIVACGISCCINVKK